MDDSPADWPDAESLEVFPDQVSAVLQEGRKPPFRLVDCREEDEWEICRIDGAELIPLSRFKEEFATRLPDPGEPVVIYCHHGRRSANAAGFLRHRGYMKVWSLAGGVDRWSEEIDPVVPRY